MPGIPGSAEGDDNFGCRGFAVSADEVRAGGVSLECKAPVNPVDVPTPPAQGFRCRCQGVMVGKRVGMCWFGKMIVPKMLGRDCGARRTSCRMFSPPAGKEVRSVQSHTPSVKKPTSWFKLNGGSYFPHECRLHYLLEYRIFSITLTAMNSGRGLHGHFFLLRT